MRLRNKTTGEIKEAKVLGVIGMYQDGKVWSSGEYATLEELYSDWEDCNEPLIKDEKIRKALRAWAEANDFDEVEVDFDIDEDIYRFSNGMLDVCFIGKLDLKYASYTITELCGED